MKCSCLLPWGHCVSCFFWAGLISAGERSVLGFSSQTQHLCGILLPFLPPLKPAAFVRKAGEVSVNTHLGSRRFTRGVCSRLCVTLKSPARRPSYYFHLTGEKLSLKELKCFAEDHVASK